MGLMSFMSPHRTPESGSFQNPSLQLLLMDADLSSARCVANETFPAGVKHFSDSQSDGGKTSP